MPSMTNPSGTRSWVSRRSLKLTSAGNALKRASSLGRTHPVFVQGNHPTTSFGIAPCETTARPPIDRQKIILYNPGMTDAQIVAKRLPRLHRSKTIGVDVKNGQHIPDSKHDRSIERTTLLEMPQSQVISPNEHLTQSCFLYPHHHHQRNELIRNTFESNAQRLPDNLTKTNLRYSQKWREGQSYISSRDQCLKEELRNGRMCHLVSKLNSKKETHLYPSYPEEMEPGKIMETTLLAAREIAGDDCQPTRRLDDFCEEFQGKQLVQWICRQLVFSGQLWSCELVKTVTNVCNSLLRLGLLRLSNEDDLKQHENNTKQSAEITLPSGKLPRAYCIGDNGSANDFRLDRFYRWTMGQRSDSCNLANSPNVVDRNGSYTSPEGNSEKLENYRKYYEEELNRISRENELNLFRIKNLNVMRTCQLLGRIEALEREIEKYRILGGIEELVKSPKVEERHNSAKHPDVRRFRSFSLDYCKPHVNIPSPTLDIPSTSAETSSKSSRVEELK